MKPIGYTLLALTGIAALAAIWSPWHWQMGATAALLLFTAAGLLGSTEKHAQEGQETAQSDQNAASGAECHPVDSDASTALPRDHYPPHGRTYGRKADQ